MARQYSAKTFFRRVPNRLLREYFQQRDVSSDVDWETLRETDVDPLFAALEELPDQTQRGIESDFATVNDLACEAGVLTILEKAAAAGHDWSQQFAEMKNAYERAFWAFLNEPQVFRVAGCFYEMDRRSGWRRRLVGTQLDAGSNNETLGTLGEELRIFYRKQGRGRFCHVDYYLRQNPQRHCYFAYPEDYTSTDLGYDEHGRFQQRARRSAFEIIFVYRPDDGILEMHARGNRKQKEALQEIFCVAVLGLTSLPDDDERTPYDLSILRDRTFPFPTEPQDRVAAVHVRQLRLDVARKERKRITLSAETSERSPSALHDLMDQALSKKMVPLDEVHISQAKMQFVFAPVDGGRSRTLTFELTCPDRCTLKDDPHDQIAKKYLKVWGSRVIDRFRQVLSRADTPKASIYFYEEIERWPKGILDRFVEMGLLREIEPSSSVQCIECEENCTIVPDIRVHPDTSETIGVYFCKANEAVGRFTVEIDRFRRWEFHLEGLARLLGAALGSGNVVEPIVPGRVWRVGTLATGGGPLDVFLTRGMCWSDAASVIERAERLRASPAPAVIVAQNVPPPDLWRGPRPTVLSLAELATWNAADLSIDFTPLLNMLRTIRPPTREDEWLTVTQAAELLMKDFPWVKLERAKVRVSKAASAKRFVTNGKMGFARRVERVSFDAWRLTQRDRDLDRADE